MKHKKSSWFPAGFTMVIVFTLWLAGFNFAYAVWSEPTSAPPAGNVPKPLNESTQFSGNVTGIYSALQIGTATVDPNDLKSCGTGNKILIWNGTDWACGDYFGTNNLLTVLNAGADAKAFGGTVYIGEDVAGRQANLYVLGGEIKSKWLHADAASGFSSINKLNVGGTTDPGSYKLSVSGGTYGISAGGSSLGGYFSNTGGTGSVSLAIGNTGVSAFSNTGNAIYGQSVTGWAGYFSGKVYLGGKVGIGTTVPGANLHIDTGSSVSKSFWVDSGGTDIGTDITSNYLAYLTGYQQNGLYVQSGYYSSATFEIARFSAVGDGYVDVPRMVIMTSGNVGIGTVTPAKKLTVNGDMEIGTSAGSYKHLRLGGGNSSGFLYGSFAKYADGIHLGYNYYADTAGANQIINTGGPTSRLSLGYG
ncbi:hypothetical protein HZA71_00950, partial [Candidatus Falkowbacteria bacterium]|nr:hypothetical protein [Candidatus Falkowbacteria bacterium]